MRRLQRWCITCPMSWVSFRVSPQPQQHTRKARDKPMTVRPSCLHRQLESDVAPLLTSGSARVPRVNASAAR